MRTSVKAVSKNGGSWQKSRLVCYLLEDSSLERLLTTAPAETAGQHRRLCRFWMKTPSCNRQTLHQTHRSNLLQVRHLLRPPISLRSKRNSFSFFCIVEGTLLKRQWKRWILRRLLCSCHGLQTREFKEVIRQFWTCDLNSKACLQWRGRYEIPQTLPVDVKTAYVVTATIIWLLLLDVHLMHLRISVHNQWNRSI